MLYLTRKVGEAVVINDDIELTIVEVKGRSVKIGFTFPPTCTVLRKEIVERISEENRQAAGSGDLLSAMLRASPRKGVPDE